MTLVPTFVDPFLAPVTADPFASAAQCSTLVVELFVFHVSFIFIFMCIAQSSGVPPLNVIACSFLAGHLHGGYRENVLCLHARMWAGIQSQTRNTWDLNEKPKKSYRPRYGDVGT